MDSRPATTTGSVHFIERRAAPTGNGSARPVLDLLVAGIEGLAHGLALLDDECQLLYCNTAARTKLTVSGWTMRGGAFCGPPPPHHGAWGAKVRQVCLRRMRQLFEVGSGEAASMAALVPVLSTGRRCALLVLGRDELCGALELQLFAAMHKLSYAEGQVLRQLSLGLSPAQIAQRHGVAACTVLTQVAAVRAKTRSPSVRHLLAQLSRIPALLPTILDAAANEA